jgi:predicted AlkP superfamily phosphohydrolase/phosphomutase
VHLNAWLREKGYLVLREEVQEDPYLLGIDWSRTQAYALGMAGIYLNRKGREARGIVEPGDAVRGLKSRIAEDLESLEDPVCPGWKPVARVYDADTIYRGPFAENGPDLVVGWARGYRVAWETVIGGVQGTVFSDNEGHWVGDHAVDPDLVPGVLFCNRRIDAERPEIIDIAPTVLDLFGVPVPPSVDGRVLGVSGDGDS